MILGVTPREFVSLFGSLGLFVAIFLAFYLWVGSDFFIASLRLLEFSQGVPALMLTLGVVVCLSVGQFDLSLAFNTSFSAYLVIALNYRHDVPYGLSIVVALAFGALVGLFNSLLITRFRINAFITTLGTGGIILGLGKVYSNGGQALAPTPADHPMPAWFRNYLGNFQNSASAPVKVLLVVVLVGALFHTINARVLPTGMSRTRRGAILLGVAMLASLAVAVSGVWVWISVNVVIFLFIATLLWVVMTYTTFGRNLYAVGSNPRAASYAGINVARHTMAAFMLAGVLAAGGGVMFAASQGSAIQGAADAFLLPAYAAAFLSTVIVSRGRFHIWGGVAGGLALTYVASALVVGGVPYTWADVINGVVLVAAVALSSVVRKSGR